MPIYTEETAKSEILQLKAAYRHGFQAHIKKDKDLLFYIEHEIQNRFPCCDDSLTAKAWLIVHPEIQLICPYGNILRFESWGKGYLCRYECKCTKEKSVNTWITNLGVIHPAKSKKVKDKQRNKMMKLYGVEYALQSEFFLNKAKQKNNILYGKDFYSQTEEFTALYSGRGKSNECLQRTQNTIFEEHGVTHPSQIHFSEQAKIVLNDKQKLEELILNNGLYGSAELLGIDARTIRFHHNKFNLSILKTLIFNYEKEIGVFLKENNIAFRKTRDIIHPLELDFYFKPQECLRSLEQRMNWDKYKNK